MPNKSTPKTQVEMAARLAELKADDRMSYPSANCQINVILAMIQIEVGAKIHALEWALGLPLSTFPLKKQPKKKA